MKFSLFLLRIASPASEATKEFSFKSFYWNKFKSILILLMLFALNDAFCEFWSGINFASLFKLFERKVSVEFKFRGLGGVKSCLLSSRLHSRNSLNSFNSDGILRPAHQFQNLCKNSRRTLLVKIIQISYSILCFLFPRLNELNSPTKAS